MMNYFNFSNLTRFICCHPSQFETSELICSSLFSKYLNQHQNGNPFPPNTCANIDYGQNYGRPTNYAPYYYGDIAYQHQQTNHISESSKYSAIMDGFRVHLKGQSRGGNHSLRSPYVHRSDEFTVSLRGWLYRLEGAALKQWKRRWCVLADYCLFYYKDMAEEKMLGSLLLPSYKISPCFSRDGISKKFAFKAEHNNMKTYYFAADSKEIQQQWMNALSLASIMQLSAIFPNNFPSSNNNKSNGNNGNKNVLVDSNPAIIRNQDLPEDESGFITYQAKRMEEESAIIYGSEYYNSNFTGQSLNMYNSVGLPLIYPNAGPDMDGYMNPPPKPQRQYFSPLVQYEFGPPTLHGYKYNTPDLVSHNPANYYLEEGYDEYFPETNFVQPYPEFFSGDNFSDFPSNCAQNRPQRPHSADFLERNQDDELDEECHNAFQNDKLNPYFKNVSNLPPKIMPTRPKSSIERYDPFLKSQICTKDFSPDSQAGYSKKASVNLENDSQTSNGYPQYSLTKFISSYGITESRYKDVEKEKSKIEGHPINYGKMENGASGLPIRPPLPLEYECKFSPRSGDDSTITSKSEVLLSRRESAGNETSYTSDDENSVREFNSKKTRKRRTKRKSNDGLNNVSDSEIQFRFDRTHKKRSLKSSRRRCVSAADYVGKSYEDLILMLIQHRRRQSDLCKSCDKLRLQMESEEKMMEIEPQHKDEYYFRFNELKQELLKVEKEYEFQMPIIESIDNMIKVKSKTKQNKLNKEKAASTSVLDTVVMDDLESIENLSQTKTTKLDFVNFLDLNDNDQSNTPSTPETPNENIENLKKQQRALEDELDRVRGLLTHSTKKLEEKAVENAQMEQEMLIARTKLKQVLDNEQEAMEITRSSKLESELAHINKVIDDLHSRRKGLNTAIENLKNPEKEILLPTSQDDMNGLISNDIQFPLSYNKTDMVTMNIKDLAKYKTQLLSDASVPLYENLNNAKKNYESEDSYPSSTKMFDHVNNNMASANEENDDFFTLNINLDKAKPYEYSRAYTEEELASNSEINNNDLKQNLNTMCEFDPTKDLHMAYGDSIVDQQIRQIYNYQTSCAYPSSQKSSDIKTVREVKRESERRKLNQQQQNYKFTPHYATDRSAIKQGSYFQSNHFYSEANDVALDVSNSLAKNAGFDILSNYHPNTILDTQHIKTETDLNDELNRNNFNAPDIVQSTIKFNEDFCEKEVMDSINLAK